MESNIDVKIMVNTRSATRQLDRATKAAERLAAELDKLKNIEIEVNTVEAKRKWWQFWRWFEA